MSLNKPALVVSVISSVLLVLFYAFRWRVIDMLTVFGILLIQLIVFILFLISFIWSLVFLFRHWKNDGGSSLVPLLLNTATIFIVILVPFTAISIEQDFKSKLVDRENVVEQIKSGTLANNVSYNKSLIHLPISYPNLSSGGNDILVEGEAEDLRVFFFTFRGVLDNFAGILYKENNELPTVTDFGCGTMLESKKFADNWYWMSCT